MNDFGMISVTDINPAAVREQAIAMAGAVSAVEAFSHLAEGMRRVREAEGISVEELKASMRNLGETAGRQELS